MNLLAIPTLLFHVLCAAKLALAVTTTHELHQAAAQALQVNNYKKALDFLSQAIQIDAQDATILNTVGVVYDAAGDVDRAAEYFASSLQLDPNAFSTNYNAANLMHYGVFEKNGNRADALESSTAYYLKAYETLVFSSKDNNANDDIISKAEKFRFLTDAGSAMMKAAKYVEAIQLFTKVLEIDPMNPNAMSDLSLAFLGSGDINQAQRFSTMAIERSPTDVKLQRNHALILRNASIAPEDGRGESLEQEGNANDIIFGMSFDYQHGATNVTHKISIEMSRSDDPVAVLDQLQSRLELDLLTSRWLYANFHHALARLNEHVVLESPVDLDGQDLPRIRVHYGDDLFALSRSYAHQHSLSSNVADVIFSSLVDKVPQHKEVTWVNARKRQQYRQADTKIGDNYLSAVRRNRRSNNSDQCKITLAIVTTGELQSLYNLITKFPASNHICEVVILDYLFSAENKIKIIEDFPQFYFVFFAKKNRDNGHAVSLNTILTTIKTPYVLQMNDSWEPIGDCSERIDRAYLLIEATQSVGMPVAQVVLNEQSSTACAFGLSPSDCRNNAYYGKAGWSRRMTVDSTSFDFIEHEFGVQYNDHKQSSSWPGFTSNHPALWNLSLLTSNANIFFNEGRRDYDLIFALKVLESGMTTVHLPDMGFRYIGK